MESSKDIVKVLKASVASSASKLNLPTNVGPAVNTLV